MQEPFDFGCDERVSFVIGRKKRNTNESAFLSLGLDI